MPPSVVLVAGRNDVSTLMGVDSLPDTFPNPDSDPVIRPYVCSVVLISMHLRRQLKARIIDKRIHDSICESNFYVVDIPTKAQWLRVLWV